MFDPFSSWSRMMAAGMSVLNTNLRVLETLSASGDVIAARTPKIGAALASPLTADHAELARMLPEKIKAFSLAGSAGSTVWWEAQLAWAEHFQHLSEMTTRGRMPTPLELANLGNSTAALATASLETAAKLGASTLAPIHRQATSNAKRLKRKPAKPNR